MESIGHYGGGRSYGGAALMNQAQADESNSRIRDGITMTEELLVNLHTTIERLEKRLEPALSPTGPQVNQGPDKSPTPINSAVLGRVGNCNAAISLAIERLNRLAQRVEI